MSDANATGVRVVVVEDHPVTRMGIVALLVGVLG